MNYTCALTCTKLIPRSKVLLLTNQEILPLVLNRSSLPFSQDSGTGLPPEPEESRSQPRRTIRIHLYVSYHLHLGFPSVLSVFRSKFCTLFDINTLVTHFVSNSIWQLNIWITFSLVSQTCSHFCRKLLELKSVYINVCNVIENGFGKWKMHGYCSLLNAVRTIFTTLDCMLTHNSESLVLALRLYNVLISAILYV
jgi:hypothetical protein